ncbi:MAG: exo-alpha-sialidase [Ignavibacteria bacterium]|nr:exo-alpha-sialidase [Ignavibacteria bacterium]
MINKLLVFSLFLANFSFSQTVYRNILITNESEPSEVTISVSPFDNRNFVGAANIATYFYTFDGGLTWNVRKMESTYGVWGDPCIVADTRGKFHYFHLSNYYEDGGTWLDRMVCQSSDDGGITWSSGTFFGVNPPHLQDKEWAAVDNSYSIYRNNIYSAWTQCGQKNYKDNGVSINPLDSASNIMFVYSTDGAETWSTSKRINQFPGAECSDAGHTVLGAMPCVGIDGEVYVAWASPLGIVVDRSTDGGVNFMDIDVVVSDMPGGFRYQVPGVYRCFGFPSMACDMSESEYKGNLYICWADQRSGTTNTDVWISISSDKGLTWSQPSKVNDDNGAKHQFFSWLTIDQQTGIIYIVFYDRRNYEDDHTDVYLASSSDGGRTFLNERISESPFFPLQETFMGDYTNIAASNGVIRPIWTRLDSNKLSIWTAIIDK